MDYPMTWEVAELVRQKTGIRLWQNARTADRIIDERHLRGYRCILYGPWYPMEEDGAPNRDLRIFVCWRALEGTVTMQLLVQDADDDTFLNSNASGAERFDTGVIWVSPVGEAKHQ